MTAEKKFKTFADLRLLPQTPETSHNQQDNSTNLSNDLATDVSTTSMTSTPGISSSTSTPSFTSIPSRTSYKNTTPKNNHLPVAPIKDFQKVPNSVTREIMPSGLFRGKSKQIYDYLYSITRGAINPSRTTRKSRKEIQRGSGIGSMVTVDAALAHLESIGLIRIRSAIGSLVGNEYEIFTPEETLTEFESSLLIIPSTGRTSSTSTSTPSLTSLTSPIQILDDLGVPFSSTSSTTESIDNKVSYSDANTSLKTNSKNDDERTIAHPAFSIMIEKLETAAKKITGKNTSKQEAEKWGNLAEILILQLEIAASRTGEISSVPAFLTEVLRRKILKPVPQSPSKQSKLKKDTIRKPETECIFEIDAEGRQVIKPLDEKGREEGLTMLQEFSDRDDILDDFKKWFVEEDWRWLMERLKN